MNFKVHFDAGGVNMALYSDGKSLSFNLLQNSNIYNNQVGNKLSVYVMINRYDIS